MKYNEYEMVFSSARLNKYKYACAGNQRKTILLYRYNVKLCQKCYGVLSVFEVALRNSIDRHYRSHFNDSDWIIHQLQPGGMLEFSPHKTDALKQHAQLVANGKYSSDKMLSAQSMGFWTYMFNKIPYNAGGKTLLSIFPNKQSGVGQRVVCNELKEIKNFRNRVAHLEPICFDSMGNKSLAYSLATYKQVLKYLGFLGYREKELLYGYDVLTQNLLQRIMNL